MLPNFFHTQHLTITPLNVANFLIAEYKNLCYMLVKVLSIDLKFTNIKI